MNEDEGLGHSISSRRTDPWTSHAAEHGIKPNQRTRLLLAFSLLVDATDEEAMEYAEGVSPYSEYAKRCSELRADGYIEPTGGVRRGAAGALRQVSRITEAGFRVLGQGQVETKKLSVVPAKVRDESKLNAAKVEKMREFIALAEERGWDSLPLGTVRKIIEFGQGS